MAPLKNRVPPKKDYGTAEAADFVAISYRLRIRQDIPKKPYSLGPPRLSDFRDKVPNPKPEILKLNSKPQIQNSIVLDSLDPETLTILGGSWDLVSKVISTLIGVISSYKYSYHSYNPSY